MAGKKKKTAEEKTASTPATSPDPAKELSRAQAAATTATLRVTPQIIPLARCSIVVS